jgi:sugar lactone lactonase YvrE
VGYHDRILTLQTQNAGNFSAGHPTPGSWSTWSLDFNPTRGHSSLASVKKIVHIPSAEFLNGLTAVPTASGILLAADPGKGLVYRINTSKKSWSVFLDDPTLKPNLTASVKIGVNGVHVYRDQLYFDNTFRSPLLARVPFHPESAKKAGPVEVLFKAASFPLNEANGQADDFSFDSEGNIWLASRSSSVVKLDIRKKTQKLIAGGPDDPTLIGTTATAFGRTKKDKDVLYITTNGGLSDPSVVGVIGGKVLALKTKGL